MALALKEIIDSRGITVDELAEQTGFSKAMIWNYGSGRRNPDPEQLCILADALDISLDLLVRGKEKDRPVERSVRGVMERYDSMSDEQINLLITGLQALLADRQFQAHLRQDEQ